jgi:hypothetical protein
MPSTKKRTRDESKEEDPAAVPESEQDVDLQSPTAKKQNTLQSPPASAITTNSETISAAAPTASTASTATTNSVVSSRGGSKRPPPVDEEEEFINNINNNKMGSYGSSRRSTVNNTSNDMDDIPPPLPMHEASHPDENQLPVNDNDNNTAKENGDIDNVVDTKDDSLDNNESSVSGNKSALTVQTKSYSLFYRLCKRELFLLLVVLGVIFFVTYLVLWMTVSMYDMADQTLEIHQCRQSRSFLLTSTNVANNDNFRNSQFYSSNNNNHNRQEEFHRQELEKQVQYWKRQAKQNELFAQGYKDEYQAMLKQLEGE